MRKCLVAAYACLLSAVGVHAELGIGSTRDEVIAQLGVPKSKLGANGREIFGYPGGRITLIDGQGASIDWKGEMPKQPASSPTAAPSATPTAAVAAPAPVPTVKRAAPSEAWFTDFSAAQAEAEKSRRRLLVLFTGSDWCPACMEFEANVAHADDFLNVTRPAFVLVKLDFPRNASQPAALRARNEELRRKYGVGSYPSLYVMSADGAKSARVETSKPRQASDIVDFYRSEERRVGKECRSRWSPY